MEKAKKPIEYNSIANNNMDKSSRSVISKSSRLTKKNPEEEHQEVVSPYFRRDKAGDRVLERASMSKSQEKVKDHQLDKIGKIIEDLFGRHQKAK